MSEAGPLTTAVAGRWPGWCCSYCAAPLEGRVGGFACRAEGRFFSTQQGVHRLLPEDRYRETRPLVELRRLLRRGAPPQAASSAARFPLALAEAALGRGPWRALQVGAGDCRVSAWLAAQGHGCVAVDVDLDPEDGLCAPGAAVVGLERAEAELDALPLEPAAFDLVVAAGALQLATHPVRALVEWRRVTRRGGALVVSGTPVFERRADGERLLAEQARQLALRHGIVVPAEDHAAGFLVRGELEATFRQAGWSASVHGWPGRLRERAGDALGQLRRGRRPARWPLVVARRDG